MNSGISISPPFLLMFSIISIYGKSERGALDRLIMMVDGALSSDFIILESQEEFQHES